MSVWRPSSSRSCSRACACWSLQAARFVELVARSRRRQGNRGCGDWLQDKLDACIRLGADVGINYKEGDFAPKVLEATSNQGVDLILDFIGASYWAQNLASLAIEGRLVLLGTMGGSVAGSTEVGAILRSDDTRIWCHTVALC